ncbi:hypothetical protein F444_02011, partial [Phytophthora nicotianae P1976]
MSLNWSGSSIDATYESASADFKHVTDMYRKTSDDSVTSLTHQLIDGELSFLKGASSKSILKKAADISTKEVFESRILSRDLITLEDDIMDAFSDMCNALGRQKYRDEYIANAHNKLLHDVKAREGLERNVLIPLLALMDALRSDGSVDSSAVPASMRAAVGLGLDGNYLKEIFHISIWTRFCQSKVSFKTKTTNANREYVFSDLMKLMKASKGPLAGRDMIYLKAEIKKDPRGIAGDWQMAKLLLECDNMVDLNTPTCHTKETLAHLAVKFGHMEVFVGLHRNAVDFRTPNAKGQFVWEMTADRTFSEKIRDVATEMEFTSRLGRGRRDSPGVFQQQLTRLAEQSRKL